MVKTITIREKVYAKLLSIKRSDESFSELLERLAGTAAPLDVLIRLRRSVEFTDKRKLISEIRSARAERRI